MTPANDVWLARHRARWLRPNAHLYVRPDAHRFMRPDAGRYLRPNWKSYVQPGFTPLVLPLLEGKANFNPNQPRVPKDNPGGGQWATGGGTGGPADDENSPMDDAGGGADGVDENDATEFSASRRSVPGFARPLGHHPVSRAVFRKRPFPPETKKVFEETTTGRLRAGPHRWSREHDIYNQAVDELVDSFLAEKGLTPETTTPDHAREIIRKVWKSTDPRIRNFNLNIMRRELMHILRRGPRRLE